MSGSRSKAYAIIALVGSVLGLVFAGYSTLDYASHLDRRLHDVHCSFIPGAAATAEAEACRAAMYSPYSALLKDSYWGGIPISLFALGAFTFFFGFAIYLLLARPAPPRVAVVFFAIVAQTPLLVSLILLSISLTELGLVATRRARGEPPRAVPSTGNRLLLPLAWLVGLAVTTLVPAVVYAASVPDQRPFLAQCGELKVPKPTTATLLKMRGACAVQAAVFFEDPLCPTCKAFHERLVREGVFDRLDAELALFPLDSECNWMLNEPLHPGACIVSKAVLCGEERARQVLEWAYEEQVYLSRAGKAGPNVLRAVIKQRWGDELLRCVDDRKTEVRINEHLHFASENNVPVSTPQIYFGKKRICDEDTDIGLRFTLSELAPEVLK